MADDLQQWLKDFPSNLRREMSREFAVIVDEELVQPITVAAPLGKTGRTKASVRKIKGEDDLSWVVLAGGTLTTKTIGNRTYRSEIDISSGDTQGVSKGNASVVYDYALGLEFGNHHSPAQPFFYGTARARRQTLQQRVEDLLDNKMSKL